MKLMTVIDPISDYSGRIDVPKILRINTYILFIQCIN